ncbi:Uncharacterised protein [Escherichia coli]|nr:Uncharacterised protein [Escherichia coli]
MNLDGFHNLKTHGVAGIQTGHRILKNHRHFRADQLTPLFLGYLRQIPLVEFQFVGHHLAGIID